MFKKVKLFVLGISVVFLSLGSFQAAAQAAESSFAFVDVALVFDSYEKTKDNDRRLQDEGRKKEEERDALVYDIRQLKDELVLLTGDNKEKKQALLEEKIKSLQDFDRNAKRELGEQRSEVVREIFDDIDAAIKRYGERKGYDFILNEKALLYKSEGLDITQDIIDELNKGAK